MKSILTIIIFFVSTLQGCWGQYPKLKVSKGRVISTNEHWFNGHKVILSDTSDIIFPDTLNLPSALFINLDDIVPVIMLISDTSIINGKINNKVVWIKGYRVNADYNTYYLDVNKRPLDKNIIIWLDQNN